MSKLEDQLILTILEKYKNKGINPQKLLNNQLFQQLPLDKKIAYIEQFRAELGEKPGLNFRPIIPNAIMGAIIGATGLAVRRATYGGAPVPPSYYLLAGAAGAGLASVVPSIFTIKDRNRDSSIQGEIANNKYLSALATASVIKPVDIPKPNLTKIPEALNEQIGNFLHNVNNWDGISREDQ